MERIVQLKRADGSPYKARLRTCTPQDRRNLVATWVPILELGPDRGRFPDADWLDRKWRWDALDDVDELACKSAPDCIVIADEEEPDAQHDLLGVLVSTGPMTPREASYFNIDIGDEGLVWVENIAVAPSIRENCRDHLRRDVSLTRVGSELMLVAIERSKALGCNGCIGLQAEGKGAVDNYVKWKMSTQGKVVHPEDPRGNELQIFFGDNQWATNFIKVTERSKNKA